MQESIGRLRRLAPIHGSDPRARARFTEGGRKAVNRARRIAKGQRSTHLAPLFGVPSPS